MRKGNVNHVFANGFSLLDDDPIGPNDFSQNFPFQGELWDRGLRSRLANESDEPRETTSTEYVRTVRLQSEKLWQWIKKSESSSHFDSNSDSISSEDPKIGYRRCCMRSQSSKGSPNEKKEPSIWALSEGGGWGTYVLSKWRFDKFAQINPEMKCPRVPVWVKGEAIAIRAMPN